MFEVIIQNHVGEMYDISQVAEKITYEDNINKSGILNISLIENEITKQIEEGNRIRVKYNNTVYFLGYIFKRSFSENGLISFIAYDSLRYLKAKDTYVFNGITASKAIAKICADFKLDIGKIDDTKFLLPKLKYDDKILLDIISDMLKLTLRYTSQLFYIKNEAGNIILRNVTSSLTDFVVDTETNIFGYSYDSSIDDDTYNQIVLVKDDEEAGIRRKYVSKDSGNIRKWGLLQYYEKVSEEFNAAQMKHKADGLLSLKNRALKTLSNVKVLGSSQLRAGNMIYVNIQKHNIQGYLLCTSAKHDFSSGHTVTADFKLI